MSWTNIQAAALEAALAALDEAGIKWLVLRNHQGLPQFNRSKDVDLGLDKRDFRKAEKAISEAVRQNGFDRVQVSDFQYVRCLTFFNTCKWTPQSIKIDLLDGFVFRGAQVFHFPEVYAASRSDGGFTVPSKTDDAVMLWLKPLVTGGIVKPKYREDIERVARDDPAGFQAVLDRILPPFWATRSWAHIAGGDIEGTVALKSGLRRSLWFKALRRDPVATLRGTTQHVIDEVIRRLQRNPATFFSVMGPDGVGKSTFIEGFCDTLTELKVQDRTTVLVFHFRPTLIPNIKKLLTGKSEPESQGPHNPHSAEPASMPSSLLRITYYWTDYVLGYWLKLRHRMIRDRTIVFDRYFYDFIVDPRRSRLSLPGWVPRLYLAATPQPDLVFFLDTTAEEIYARKQELQPEEIERQLSAYRRLAEQDPDRFVRLDAGQPPEDVINDALKAVVLRSFQKIGS